MSRTVPRTSTLSRQVTPNGGSPAVGEVLDDESVADKQQGRHCPPEPDIREIAGAEPPQVAEDNVRVPTGDETSAAIERANRALAEMRSRDEMDAREEQQRRADQLAGWQARDETDDEPDKSGADEEDIDALDQAEV